MDFCSINVGEGMAEPSGGVKRRINLETLCSNKRTKPNPTPLNSVDPL